MAAEQVTEEVKAALRQEYLTLNPVTLLRQIRQQQAVLWKLAVGEATLAPVSVS